MSEMRVRSKIWLEIDGRPLLGDGREGLLREVDACGSIHSAARSLGLSYRKAWAQLRDMEVQAPFPILVRQRS